MATRTTVPVDVVATGPGGHITIPLTKRLFNV